jgi:hypothetical protein
MSNIILLPTPLLQFSISLPLLMMLHNS